MTTRKQVSALVRLAPALSGVLIGLSFPPSDFHVLAWVALIPIAWCWTQSSLPRSAFWSAYVGGVVSFLLGLSWMRSCYSDGAAWWGPNADAWLALSLVYGAVFVLVLWYGHWCTRAVGLPSAVVVPLVWVSCEILRNGGSVVLHQVGFPWCNLGMTQAEGRILIQVADLGGEHAVSLVVAMVNGAILDGMRCLWPMPSLRRRPVGGPILAAVVLIAVVLYGHWRLTQREFVAGPVICLMTEVDLPPFLNQARIAESARPIRRDVSAAPDTDQHPDILLWPEMAWHHKLVDVAPHLPLSIRSAVPADVKAVAGIDLEAYTHYVRAALEQSAKETNATLLVGCERVERTGDRWKRYNSLVCVDPMCGLVGCYDKCHPVPGREFKPFRYGSVDAAGEMPYQRGVAPVVFKVRARGTNSIYRCATALCYDLCFASHFRSPRDAQGNRSTADFFLQSGAEGQDPKGILANLMRRSARFRAIETRRSIVRNVSHGASGIIDGNGEMSSAAAEKILREPCRLGPVPVDDRTSWYAYWGDSPLVVLCILAAIVVGLRQTRSRGRSCDRCC